MKQGRPLLLLCQNIVHVFRHGLHFCYLRKLFEIKNDQTEDYLCVRVLDSETIHTLRQIDRQLHLSLLFFRVSVHNQSTDYPTWQTEFSES